jgi:hypothetical protein
MADFCKQCSIQHLGTDYRDFVGVVEEGETWFALCEGCGGFVEVDYEGQRVDVDNWVPYPEETKNVMPVL